MEVFAKRDIWLWLKFLHNTYNDEKNTVDCKIQRVITANKAFGQVTYQNHIEYIESLNQRKKLVIVDLATMTKTVETNLQFFVPQTNQVLNCQKLIEVFEKEIIINVKPTQPIPLKIIKDEVLDVVLYN